MCADDLVPDGRLRFKWATKHADVQVCLIVTEATGLEPATSAWQVGGSCRFQPEPNSVTVSDVTVTRCRTVESFTSLTERWFNLC